MRCRCEGHVQNAAAAMRAGVKSAVRCSGAVQESATPTARKRQQKESGAPEDIFYARREVRRVFFFLSVFLKMAGKER